MSHTSGEWHWFHTPHSSNQEYVVKVGRFHIASVDFVGNSVTEKANAMLIAAAPDLLAALTDACAAMAVGMTVAHKTPGSNDALTTIQIAFAQARAAISKATGAT